MGKNQKVSPLCGGKCEVVLAVKRLLLGCPGKVF
jgi:hypothetical protein